MNIKIASLLLLVATPVSAWEVTRERDRMTDRTMTWAAARSGAATLLVGCLNGEVSPRLTWPGRIGVGTIGVSYRVDDGPVIPRMAMLSQAGNVLYPWIASGGAEVMRAKRLRVQLSGEVYDYGRKYRSSANPSPLPAALKGWQGSENVHTFALSGMPARRSEYDQTATPAYRWT